MKIIFWANGNRGLICLQEILKAGYEICLVVVHPKENKISLFAKEKGLACKSPENPNAEEFIHQIKPFNADLFILAGYGKILKQPVIDIPRKMTINLHGGKLPHLRGSSPMNWALIAGEKKFTLSIIKVDGGIDSGDILAEKSFPIKLSDTIRELHFTADQEFPKMLLNVVQKIKKGKLEGKKQDLKKGAYYPLRFPEDGMIIWDMLTAEEIYNHVRALAEPYPCARTIYQGRVVKLFSAEFHTVNFFGTPGRIYKRQDGKFLICAKDKCLWITDAAFEDNGEKLFNTAKLYDELLTVRKTVVLAAMGKKSDH